MTKLDRADVQYFMRRLYEGKKNKKGKHVVHRGGIPLTFLFHPKL